MGALTPYLYRRLSSHIGGFRWFYCPTLQGRILGNDMSTGTNSIQVGAWVAGVFLIALGLLAVFFPAGAYEKSFFGLLSLPVGVTVLMSLLIERWWPVGGRRMRRWQSR